MRIYLDHNATTPLRGEVVAAMLETLREVFGNPSSTHQEGARARARLEAARSQVADLLGVAPGEVIFTAGATEANNTVLLGSLWDRPGATLVTSAAAHPSISEAARLLESRGVRVVWLPVDRGGRIDPAELSRALEDGADLVSLLWANNETGVLQPVEEIVATAGARGVPVHLDATQALGKVPVDLREVPADLVSVSAHKLNGPKGVGALVVRGGRAPGPWIHGGPQERRRRGGTENLPGAVGFGAACELARRELPQRGERMGALRDRLWRGIHEKVPRVRRNGDPDHVLPNTLNLCFDGVAGEILLEALDGEGVAASAGAACASGSIEPSAVLAAMGLTPEEARGSLRFSVGFGVDEGQIDHVLAILPGLVERVRGITP